MAEIDWHLGEMYNLAGFRPQRPLVKRMHINASELGGSLVDFYLKANAVPYTDPPNTRSLGKFLAGNLWEECIKNILKAVGIFHKDQVRYNTRPYSDTIEVHGICDMICGAFEIEAATAQLDAIKPFIPEDLYFKGLGIISQLGGKPLKTKGIELKSCSSYVYDKVEKTKQPMKQHGFQAYYYQRASGIPFDVSYISKDDSNMVDVPIDEARMEPIFRKYLEQATYCITKNIVPPEEPILFFNELLGKFEKNIQIEYSPYISMRGYSSPYDFRKSVEPVTKRWNNALDRYARNELGQTTPTGKKLKLNPEVRDEMVRSGYKFDELLRVKMQHLDDENGEESE